MQMIETFSTTKPAPPRMGDGVADSEKPEYAQEFRKVFEDHVDPKGKNDGGQDLGSEPTVKVDATASDDSDQAMSVDDDLAAGGSEIQADSDLVEDFNSNRDSIGGQGRIAEAEDVIQVENIILDSDQKAVLTIAATQDGQPTRNVNSETNRGIGPGSASRTHQNPSPIEAVMVGEMAANGQLSGAIEDAVIKPAPLELAKVSGATVALNDPDSLARHPEVKSNAISLATDAVRAAPVQNLPTEEGRRLASVSLPLETNHVITSSEPKNNVNAGAQMGDVRLLTTSTTMSQNTQFQPALPFNPVVLRHGAQGEDSPNSSFEFAIEARHEARQQLALGTSSLPSRLEMNQSVIRQMTDAVRAQMTNEKTIEISLRPAELGRVRIAMSPADTGMVVTIQAERAETLELMRRNIDDLARSLADMGHENPTFNFEQGGAFADKDDRPLESRPSYDDSSMDQNPMTESPTHTQTLRTQTTGVDILL